MSFVAEELSDEQWKQYLALVAKYQSVLCLDKQVAVDRVRDSVFLSCGGRGTFRRLADEPPNGYLLLWRGHAVPFKGYETWDYGKPTVSSVITIESIGVPKGLEQEIEAIKSAIRDAFACLLESLWSKPINVIAHFPEPHLY